MLGSIVSGLASPIQDGMKQPEMHKKNGKNFLDLKKNLGGKKILERK